MERTSRTKRAPRAARSLPACLRQFLTPAAWKQAHRGLPKPRKNTRWDPHNLILVVFAMTWCLGDSTAERFEMARGIVVLCRPKRHRPGRTSQGFQKALARLPLRPLVTLSDAIRGRILTLFGDRLREGGFIPIGCDGSRLECPRTETLRERLPTAGKDQSAPTLWVTACVHLTTGMLWSWRIGKGTASERDHLQALLPTLPPTTLLVADAGYYGYDLAAAALAAGTSILIRMSSKVHLITDQPTDSQRFDHGDVLYWPKDAQNRKLPPLPLRLIRVRARRKGQGQGQGKARPRTVDVWLLTNVPDSKLSVAQAGRFYRLRWENEGLFRTYKRTFNKVRLVGRTIKAVHREAYGSMLACQILLAHGAWALNEGRDANAGEPELCSARQAIQVVRQELMAAMKPEGRASYLDRLANCRRERRERTSEKEKRPWPRRAPHKPPKPPKLRTMTDGEKTLYSRLNAAATAG